MISMPSSSCPVPTRVLFTMADPCVCSIPLVAGSSVSFLVVSFETGLCCSFFQFAHFQEGHQKGERRFSSLVFIGTVGMQTVSAPARGNIVKRNLQVVISQKPIEGRPRFLAPDALTRCTIGLEGGGNHRASFDGLLIEAGFFRILRVEPLRSNG